MPKFFHLSKNSVIKFKEFFRLKNLNKLRQSKNMKFSKAKATTSAIGVGVFVGDRVGAHADDQ